MSRTSVWAMTLFFSSSSLLSWLVSFSVFPSLTWSKLFCWWLLWCPAPMLTLEHPLSITWNHWFPYPWLCYSSTLLFPRFLLIILWPSLWKLLVWGPQIDMLCGEGSGSAASLEQTHSSTTMFSSQKRKCALTTAQLLTFTRKFTSILA